MINHIPSNVGMIYTLLASRNSMATAKKRKLVAWTKDDVKSLRAFAKAKLSGAATAKKLRRTPGAVAQKAMALGVKFRSVRRKKV
jgi:hypothetical protein